MKKILQKRFSQLLTDIKTKRKYIYKLLIYYSLIFKEIEFTALIVRTHKIFYDTINHLIKF